MARAGSAWLARRDALHRLPGPGISHLHRGPRPRLQAFQLSFFTCCLRSCCRVFFLPGACQSGLSGSTQVIPVTHFLQVVPGLLLKGEHIGGLAPGSWRWPSSCVSSRPSRWPDIGQRSTSRVRRLLRHRNPAPNQAGDRSRRSRRRPGSWRFGAPTNTGKTPWPSGEQCWATPLA